MGATRLKGTGTRAQLGCFLQLVSSVSQFFKPFFINLNFVGDETGASVVLKSDMKLKYISIHVFNNTKPGATTVAFRDDGVSVASINIPATTTGDIDSGELDVVIKAGSKISYLVDMTAAGVGLLGFVGHFEYEGA